MTTISWKDIIESQITELDKYGTPEDMYQDPAESTQDEWTDLLYEIDHDIRNANGLSEPGLRALRAVVELHYPSGIFCRGCGFIEEYNEPAQLLPCPTIQAIQKVI